MTLTFGIAMSGPAVPGATERTRATPTETTPETIMGPAAGRSITTWATTRTAGTRRASAARRPATWTITRPPSWAAASARPPGPRTAPATDTGTAAGTAAGAATGEVAATRGRPAPSNSARPPVPSN